ncbi:hypothetical protein LTS08_006281 [Lithohypha guttulata]|nr:hypothetical protein LTS08_006281 [Lithohypha guttulata]
MDDLPLPDAAKQPEGLASEQSKSCEYSEQDASGTPWSFDGTPTEERSANVEAFAPNHRVLGSQDSSGPTMHNPVATGRQDEGDASTSEEKGKEVASQRDSELQFHENEPPVFRVRHPAHQELSRMDLGPLRDDIFANTSKDYRSKVLKVEQMKQSNHKSDKDAFFSGVPVDDLLTCNLCEPDKLVAALKDMGIDQLTSIQWAVMDTYLKVKSQQVQDRTQANLPGRTTSLPDLKIISGYNTGKTLAYALLVVDYIMSVRAHIRDCVRVSSIERQKKIIDYELQTGTVYAAILCNTRPACSQTAATVKSLCRELKINVVEASNFNIENRKGANKEEIMASQAHIIIATPGRFTNLILDDETDRAVHPMYKQDPESLQEPFAKEVTRASYWASTGAIVFDDAYDTYHDSDWREDLETIREYLMKYARPDLALICASPIEVPDNIPFTLHAQKMEHWLLRPPQAPGLFTVRLQRAPNMLPESSLERLCISQITPLFFNHDTSGNGTSSVTIKALNTIHLEIDGDTNRPRKTLIIVGTRYYVEEVYIWATTTRNGMFDGEVTSVHGDYEGQRIENAYHAFINDEKRILVATSGMVRGLNLTVDNVNVLLFGPQAQVTVEELMSSVATAGRNGIPGNVTLLFCNLLNDVIAFSKIYGYLVTHQIPSYQCQAARWTIETEKLLGDKYLKEAIDKGSSREFTEAVTSIRDIAERAASQALPLRQDLVDADNHGKEGTTEEYRDRYGEDEDDE